ncbi:I78 family peptidase inhibitor [Maricaulis maris]|uniref:Peptidase inhibitor I78 family protein n=1 Tax=Maricaulis maris TaxID=74318 RepID=A0A495D1V6_9PROT|nr:I78 family peptidase inhibitor [Maricaulis maris]RKQ95532.1 peptidase inhibitor I78 family protein [Maricaulis maris]
MTRYLLIALAGLSVAACSTGGHPIDGGETVMPTPDFEADDAAAPDPGAFCGANAMGYLVGQRIEEVDLETLHGNIRVIHPGMPITRDYRRERLNLDLDEAGVILRPWCG